MSNILKPIQPYFVIESPRFYQEVYRKYGISHFYTFQLQEKQREIMRVPDGCLDILFIYYENRMTAKVIGTTLSFQEIEEEGKGEYFGVRFFPGEIPVGVNLTPEELVERQYILEDCLESKEFVCRMEQQVSFEKRIDTFLNWYQTMRKRRKMQSNTKKIISCVLEKIYQTNGSVRIHELEEYTGYTTRYLNKLFTSQVGISPKGVCKIVQFQKALECLSYRSKVCFAEIAAEYGYYDQAQFDRNFKHYCHITPKEYHRIIIDKRYKDQVVDTCYL